MRKHSDVLIVVGDHIRQGRYIIILLSSLEVHLGSDCHHHSTFLICSQVLYVMANKARMVSGGLV